MHYNMACHKYFLIWFSYTIQTVQKFQFQFSYSWAVQNYLRKWSVYHEKFWLKFRIHAKFRAKQFIYYEWMCNFVQNWFSIDTKIMRKFVQKSHFLQNHATGAQENWLFRGNPSIEWAPPPCTTGWYKDWVCTLHSGYWFKPAAYSLQAGYLAPGYSRVTLIGQTCKHI